MPEHTPGPWVADNQKDDMGDGDRTWLVVGGDGTLVCENISWAAKDDALLISAAPSMLMALKAAQHSLAVLDCRDSGPGWRDLDATEVDALISGALLRADRAIAQAEGRSE